MLQFYTAPCRPLLVEARPAVDVVTTKADVYRYSTGVQVYSVLSLDVYSFAIILHEIIARAGVWGGTLGPDVSRAATLFTYLPTFI